MDFPSDVLTNVYKIDDVREIYWAFYSRRIARDEHEDEEEEEARRYESDAEGKAVKDALEDIECSLRGRGHLVLSDEDKPGLWVFCLSEAENGRVAQIEDLGGFECLQSGCIRSSDLPSASSPLTNAPSTAPTSSRPISAIAEINTHTFGLNTKVEPRPPATTSEEPKKGYASGGQLCSVTNIYPRILAAISHTLSYYISSTKGRLLLGSCTYVDERTLGDRTHEHLESYSTTAGTTIVSWSLRWLSSGILLIALSEHTVPRLSTVQYVVSHSRSPNAVPLESSLILSPSGLLGQYHGAEKTPKFHPLYRERATLKSSICAGLMVRGISMPVEPQWIWVSAAIDNDPEYHESQGAQEAINLTLWPAHLCLRMDVQNSREHSEKGILQESTAKDAIDPLERAQAWFLGKSARMEALEARRRKDAAEAQITKDIADMEDEVTGSDLESVIARDITPRDLSGIYPTPPDGLPSIARDSSVNNEPHSVGHEDEMNGENASNKIRQPYREEKGDDLFQEVDIDLFATNGLTEDDFNFFDEPSLRNGDEVDNAVVGFSSRSPFFEGPADIPRDTSPLIDHPSPGQEVTLDPTPYNRASETENVMEASKDWPMIEMLKNGSSVTERILPNADHMDINDQTSNEEYMTGDALLDFDSLLPRSPRPQKASFDSVPFNSASFEIDSKYNSVGRYAFQMPVQSMASRAGEQSSRGNYVPHFGVLEMGTSAVGSGKDTGKFPILCVSLSCTDKVGRADDTDVGSSDGDVNISEAYDTDGDDDGEEGYDEPMLRKGTFQHSIHENYVHCSEPIEHPDTPLSSTSPREDQADLTENGTTLVAPTGLFSQTFSRRHIIHSDLKFENDDQDVALFVGQDQNFVQVAQMVAHQAVSGFDTLQLSKNDPFKKSTLAMTVLRRDFQESLAILSSKWGKVSKQCKLKDFIDLDDPNSSYVSRDPTALQQKISKPSHPTRALSMMGQAVFKFQQPFTCVQRTGTSIELAASALRFWEELSLAPSQGSKNVTGFCVFPGGSVKEQVAIFLNMIKGAYQSCNLGLHDLGVSEQTSGLFPVYAGEGGLQSFSSAFVLACEGIGKILGRLNLRGGNTVIYVVNPSSTEKNLPALCSAFLKLFDAYLATARQNNIENVNDLVLQIVPSDLIYSNDALPMPSLSEYRRLAFEVYDRCGPDDTQRTKTSHYVCVPSIRLAKAIPKTIDFRLTPDNSALSLQADNCLHIAYAWNLGEDWLTASWTDNLGVLSWTACYSLGGGDENVWPIISEIVQEIWETTLNILQPRHGPWHLFISKSGTILKKELDVWQAVFGDGSNSLVKSSYRSSFLAVDLGPLLEFPIQAPEIKASDVAATSFATPDNTPQANAPSPDTTGHASTPGGATQVSTPPPNSAFGDHDGEARLVNIADETWGVVTKTSVDDLYMPSDRCPALACGYLVKRAGPRNEDGLVRIGVSVVHAQTAPRPLLKAVLAWYKDLGLLARVRGIADPVRSVVPYHIAAANKAHAAVTATMRYGEEDGSA